VGRRRVRRAVGAAVLNFVLGLAATAYQEAISAANRTPPGRSPGAGVSYLQSAVTFQFTDGRVDSQLGGAWTPLTYVIVLAVAVLAGRLWRLVPRSRRPPGLPVRVHHPDVDRRHDVDAPAARFRHAATRAG